MRSAWQPLLFIIALFPVWAGASDLFGDDPLPTVDEAIQLVTDADWDNQQLLLDFELIDDVYLYQHRFGFSLRDQNGNVLEDFADYALPPGKDKTDEIFGDVEVYYDRLSLTLPVNSVPLVATELEVRYQGCIEDTLCYPPTKKVIPLANPSPAKKSPAATAATPPESASPRADDGGFLSTLQSEDANAFNRWMTDRSLGLIIGLFFVGGLLLAFTPCVFPMVPILSGIIAGEKEPSASRGFVLSTSYVLGMAVPYTLAGLLVAVFGAGLNLQVLLQQPAAIITSTVIFVLLALSMFGLYELQLPAFLRNKLHQPGDSKRGSLFGAAIMGTISALVVSPCVTPILAGALIYVAASGDALTGAASLFALSMGMGLPLIIVGTGGGSLLPRAGMWMEEIKRFFGVVMLGVAIWLLDRIINGTITLGLYGLLLAVYGVQLGALEAAGEGLPGADDAIGTGSCHCQHPGGSRALADHPGARQFEQRPCRFSPGRQPGAGGFLCRVVRGLQGTGGNHPQRPAGTRRHERLRSLSGGYYRDQCGQPGDHGAIQHPRPAGAGVLYACRR